MVRILVLIFILAMCLDSHGQHDSLKQINVGIEQDVLPYITGGYFAGLWAGKGHVRFRTLLARVYKPGFIVKKGFTNNDVTAYAFLVDYFLKKNWAGLWAGTGIVFWQSSIQTDKKEATASFKTWLLNGSIGYNIKMGKNFYFGPWCALHLRIAGDRHVQVDDKIFTPPLLNPEASLKLGAYF